MAAADDSDTSSLSSAPEEEMKKLAPIFLKAKKATKAAAPPPAASPPRPKRAPSPPHEEVLADNPDIAFIVMFRSRFQSAFPPKLGHFGPQDIERGVVDARPSSQMESLLCALLGLVLNRKKPVERGHHGRALEEAVASQKAQWPHKWNGVNPLHGPKDFNIMTPVERLNLLRTLVIWSLSTSESIQNILKDSYKQQRHNDDENQPLSVQPWGIDGDKRRYFLIEGQDDTSFRVYREGSRHTKNAHWYNVAGDIDEVRALAAKLEGKEYDGSQAARRLSARMLAAVPRFEATEEKRRRREYRQLQRAKFSRPEPGFSLYEGRTRGKRMRYTFDDEPDDTLDDSDAASLGIRRSGRHTGTSTRNTPAAEAGPTYTASGRQVKPRQGGEYGSSMLSTQVHQDGMGEDSGMESRHGSEDSDPVRGGRGRATRSGGANGGPSTGSKRKREHIDGYNSIDAMSDEEESGGEWDSDANGDADDDMRDADSEEDGAGRENSEDDEDDDGEPRSLMVKLRVSNGKRTPTPQVPSSLNGSVKAEEARSEAAAPSPKIETGRDAEMVDLPAPNVATVQDVTVSQGVIATAKPEDILSSDDLPRTEVPPPPAPQVAYFNAAMKTGPAAGYTELPAPQQRMREDRVVAE